MDWQPVYAEALDIFVRYLQIDTSNPPGREAPAARFLGSLLEAEGIECEYIEIQPDREAVVARLKGDGSKRPLMLCNHTDVVPVEPQYWTYPAFEGHIEDGKVYGRGAVDMKGCGVMQTMAFILLHRLKAPLKRDVVYLAVPDEEAGSIWGMEWLCKNRPDVVDVEFELSEGGGGSSSFAGKPTRLFSVATNEKEVCWLKLTAVGTPGHGSRPHADNSAVRLMEALLKLNAMEHPFTWTADTTAYAKNLAEAGLLPDFDNRAAVEEHVRKSPELLAMFTNTLNITMLNSGIKANVIPAKSEAVIDCRLLPGQTKEDWIDHLKGVIDDENVQIELYLPDQGANMPVEWDTELYRTIHSVITDAMEDAVVTPTMTVGGTDNRFLRTQGIPAYGFIPCLLSREERAGFHGNDEFLTIDNLNMGTELMYEIAHRFCT